MPGKRRFVALAAATIGTLGFAGTALANGNTTASCGKSPLLPCDHLAVKGPIAAGPGISFPLYAKGYANPAVKDSSGGPGANQVVGWNTATACQTKFSAEAAAEGLKNAVLNTGIPVNKAFVPVKGKFYYAPTVSDTLPQGTSQEPMYWCVYLINHTTKHTFKAAFWTYTVLGPGGPPGAP